MKNCLILGSGRSGTSMIGGILSKAGYFMGDHLWPGRDSNPKGFYEDEEVNDINEELLAPVVPPRRSFSFRPYRLRRWLFHRSPSDGQRWLACVPVNTRMMATQPLADRIAQLARRSPFCFKDPRFSYTLPAWRPFLRDTVFVCVFRDPATTVQSILKECRDAEYLQDLWINRQRALRVWTLMYQHILEHHRREGEWLFLHYDQMLGTKGLNRLEAFTGATVDRSFPDESLKRTSSQGTVPPRAQAIYQSLCQLADYASG